MTRPYYDVAFVGSAWFGVIELLIVSPSSSTITVAFLGIGLACLTACTSSDSNPGGGDGGITKASNGGVNGSGGATGGAPSPGKGGSDAGGKSSGSGGSDGGRTGLAGSSSGTGGTRGSGGSAGGRSGAGGRGAGGAPGTGGAPDSGGSAGTGGASMGSNGCGKSQPSGSHIVMVDVAGASRTYEVIVPPNYANATPGPVYFVFHGAGGSHAAVDGLGFEKKYVSVFPDSITAGWDSSPSSADVLLFDQALQRVKTDYCVDSGKVFVAGFSAGGWIATGLGCLRGNVVHGFASVEGGVLNRSSDCKGPVAGWINHYKMDPAEPYSSGTHQVTFFTALDAASNPQPFDAPNPCVRYTGSAPVVFCNPDGAVHGWPDYATDAIERFFGSL